MQNIEGSVAIVTGASRGIGPFLALALAREKATLVLAARSGDDLEAVADKLRAKGATVLTVVCDVAVAEDRAALVAQAIAKFGRIDILVNNAGIGITTPYESQPVEEIEQILNVNLTAPMLLTKAVLPGMLERGSGFIVNIASLAAKVGTPFSSPYSASKGGLVMFTESFRSEFRKRGVSATAICPGFVSDAGMYEEMERKAGVRASKLAGTSSPQKVAAATIRAIKRDTPEVIVNPGPIRLISGVAELFPGLFERIYPVFGANKLFAKVAKRGGGGA